MPTDNENQRIDAPVFAMIRLLSLPQEIMQSFSGLLTDFEPWTYISTPGGADTFIGGDDSSLHNHDAQPLNFISVHRNPLGLSSRYDWVLLVFSRHLHDLSRRDGIGIASAVTQALRTMNARSVYLRWSGRDTRFAFCCHSTQTVSEETVTNVTASKIMHCAGDATREGAPTKQYHATVHEEDSWPGEDVVSTQARTVRSNGASCSSMTTALVLHRPVPVLSVNSQDIRAFATRLPLSDALQQFKAVLLAVLIALIQCRMALVENLQILDRDTPIPSIEPYDSKGFAKPKMNPGHDRMRSMSGSTVAEALPHTEPLSFSSIATVYSSSGAEKEVRWAEKRVSEEGDVGTSPKRPKLMEYKQVSSGRVATLMNQFEKFHL